MAQNSALSPSTLVSLAMFAVTVGYRFYKAWQVVRLAIVPEGVCRWGADKLRPLMARAKARLEGPNSGSLAGGLESAHAAAANIEERLKAGKGSLPMFVIKQAWFNDDLPDKVDWVVSRLAANLAVQDVAT